MPQTRSRTAQIYAAQGKTYHPNGDIAGTFRAIDNVIKKAQQSVQRRKARTYQKLSERAKRIERLRLRKKVLRCRQTNYTKIRPLGLNDAERHAYRLQLNSNADVEDLPSSSSAAVSSATVSSTSAASKVAPVASDASDVADMDADDLPSYDSLVRAARESKASVAPVFSDGGATICYEEECKGNVPCGARCSNCTNYNNDNGLNRRSARHLDAREKAIRETFDVAAASNVATNEPADYPSYIAKVIRFANNEGKDETDATKDAIVECLERINALAGNDNNGSLPNIINQVKNDTADKSFLCDWVRQQVKRNRTKDGVESNVLGFYYFDKYNNEYIPDDIERELAILRNLCHPSS